MTAVQLTIFYSDGAKVIVLASMKDAMAYLERYQITEDVEIKTIHLNGNN